MAIKRLRFGLAFLLLLDLHLLCAPAYAKRLPIRIFTSSDGLGSSFVDYLASDSRGFMWFCTRDGLSRFDGSRFVTYQVAETASPPGIENIYEARDGAYWITTIGGTYRFDPGKLTTPDVKTRSLGAEFVTPERGVIYEDRSGNLWIGGKGLYLVRLHEGQYSLIEVDLGLPDDPIVGLIITELRETADGSFWINSTRGLIRRLPDGRQVIYPEQERRSSPPGSLRMIVDRSGRVWLARSNKLFVFKPEPIDALPSSETTIVKPMVPASTYDLEPETPTALPQNAGEIVQLQNSKFIESRFAKALLQTSDNTVWIASEDHLLEFADGVFHVHSAADGLPNVINRLAEDNVGNLWIAGQSTLGRLDRKGLVTFGTEDGAASDRILAIVEGPDGTMYFGNPESQLARFDGQRLQTVKPAMDSTGSLWTSRTAYLDSRGDWWILTGKKLYRFSGVSNFDSLNGRQPTATYGRDTGLRSDGILQIFEDSTGDIWVSTRGNDVSNNGLARMRRGETVFTSFGEADGFPLNKSASSFAQDKSGNLWISLIDGGVLRFDGERFHDFAAAAGLPSTGNMTDLHLDTKGRLWITSSSSGVFRVDQPTSEKPGHVQLTTADGLTSNNVRTVTEDRFNRIYFGTARGVDRLSPDTGRIKRYTIADGLPADFVTESHCDKKGNVWFATNSGFSRLIPVLDDISPPPSVWLGGLRIAGVSQPTAELGSREILTEDLTSSQNNLVIEFYGIDFRAGENLRYQYKLEGSNADWSEPSENRSVTFANLQPASYRFLVRAVNSDGVSSEGPAVISFTILPPLWQRWWFLLICAVAIAVAIFLLFRYRVSNLRRVNRALSEAKAAEEDLRKAREERLAEVESVRARIATDLHDDIGASLTQIAILSEVAQATAANGNGAVAEPLSRITDVSNELVGTMSDIVWAINPAKDHLSDLTQRMRRVASDLLSPKGISVRFNSREEDKALTIKTNTRREVFLIFKESINNISKHSGAQNVYIDVEIERHLLLVRIRDDGNGFVCGPPSLEDTLSSEGPSGNGIRNMRKRASEMGGHFDIDSAPGRGTTTFLSLPIDAGHAADV